MNTIIYRTCEVTKGEYIYASSQLEYSNDKYTVIVTEDSDDLFVDLDIEINSNELPDVAIRHFELECLNRFTCDGQFTLKEVKENSGEEISFY